MTAIAAAALIAACGTELDPGQVSQMIVPADLLEQIDPEQVPPNIFDLTADIEFDEAGLDLAAEQAAVAQDAWELYQELAARLADRDVTFGELYDALHANDEDAIREMFGYTDAELEALSRRLVDIAGRARAAGSPSYPAPAARADECQVVTVGDPGDAVQPEQLDCSGWTGCFGDFLVGES